MYQINETKDAACFIRAQQRGQGTFTLVEQDRTAPAVVLDWIARNFATAPANKLRDAFETALRWRDSNVAKKTAD